MFEIKVKLTTVSCCLIGNQTESFSVGGVDQSTTIDESGRPIIHGSAFKGALRNIVREQEKEVEKMKETKNYVERIIGEIIDKYDSEDITKTEKIENMISNLEKQVKNKSLKAEYIFGMEGINGMPRIFCSDFRVIESKDTKIDDYFMIDTKNSLEEINGDILSNPRTYKVIKPGVKFEGVIRFYNPFSKEDSETKKIEKKIKNELICALKMFNSGVYGIGNSKSRGYGQITVDFDNDDQEGECHDNI